MNKYLIAARQVCGSEKQARVVAHMMQQRGLLASPVTAMLVMDDTLVIGEPEQKQYVEIRERFEM